MRIAFLNWRDSTHPEGGGSEKYAETVSAGLAALGHDVTMFCAAHGDAPAEERVNGYRLLRQGGRFGVYAATARRLRAVERSEGAFDVVIDTQNGIPFFAGLATGTPVVSLVHHVHREQWPVVFGPVASRVGWAIESRVAPRIYSGHQYVAVSQRTKDELDHLGVHRDHIAVIHNGTEAPLGDRGPRHEYPTLVVLGRVVPHKRIEHAVAVVERLREVHPRIRLRIVGDGWWADRVREEVARRGVSDNVTLLGHVPEDVKHAELQSAWVALAPSIKEGWGLCVVEAASHGTPTVAYHGAGGLSESIVDGVTGILVDDLDEMVVRTGELLVDELRRDQMGQDADEHAALFSWTRTIAAWDRLLRHVADGGPAVADTDRTQEDETIEGLGRR